VYPHDDIFFDITSRLGPWPGKIRRALVSSKLVLVVIGSQWLKIEDDSGRPRLQDPNDWVYQEVKTALELASDYDPQNGPTYVAPILVNDAKLPKPEELPPDLQSLVNHTAFTLPNGHLFDEGVVQLVQEIKKIVPVKIIRIKWELILLLGTIIAAIAIFIFFNHIPGGNTLPTSTQTMLVTTTSPTHLATSLSSPTVLPTTIELPTATTLPATQPPSPSPIILVTLPPIGGTFTPAPTP
jgi:hypothetical protein